MKKKKIIYIILGALLFINLPLWDFWTHENYTYRNLDGSFTYEEESGKGGAYTSCWLMYGVFLTKHPEENGRDITLYRSFTVKPWRFWEWREMIFHSDRFRLPYKQP